VSVTPFVITGLRLRGAFPVPFFSSFAELNVRTYVTAEERPGIWFFSLDASSRLAVEAARRSYKLPYFHARMSAEQRGADVAYSCSRVGAPDRRFEGRYRPAGEAFNAEPDSLDWFLAERYCLYTADRGRLHWAEIHHPLWPLQEAETVVEENTMPPPDLSLGRSGLSRFSRRQDVLVWPLRPVDS
jgi:uncharacterized protein